MPSVTSPQSVMIWHMVGIPVGMVIDGAVVELCQAPDGIITADLRIPMGAGAITAATDPDVIRGIERVTGETYHPDTGEWTR